jgi:hypothetical protein
MAIDSAVKRVSALIDHRDVILPDGAIDSGDRKTLLGQYRFAGAGVGGPGDYCLYAELLRDETQGLVIEDATQAEGLGDSVQALLDG